MLVKGLNPIRSVALVLMLILSAEASALRCGTRVVDEGDHLLEVLHACGKPSYETEWLEERIIAVRSHPLLPYYRVPVAVDVKEWTYNFGPRRLMRTIRFERGIVTDIETLDHGF